MKVLALVTARGGSKGFPGKNLAELAGRPLVVWSLTTIEAWAARHPELEIRPHLSTDDPAIAAAWPERVRPARLRPADLATDTSSSLEVVAHEWSTARAAGFAADALVLLQPTSPLVDADDLDGLWRALLDSAAGRAIGVAPAPHPPQWALAIDADGSVHRSWPADGGSQRQAYPVSWLPMGIYACTAAAWAEHAGFALDGATQAAPVSAAHAVDIDSPEDLVHAEALLDARAAGAELTIADRRVAPDAPCYVIAEAGVNHNGDPELAHRLIDAAAAAGADAVKFQTFRAADLVTAGARKARYQAATTGSDDGQLAMLQALELDAAIVVELRDHAAAVGIAFLSTPFDSTSLTLLADLGLPAIKLGSGEITNHPFIARAAALGRPLILSSGMSDLAETEAAVAVARANGDPPLAMLHCVSAYPTPPEDCNLRAMRSLARVLGLPVGFSDHTQGFELTLAAVAMGACIIEKHLTLDRALPGPDHAASLEPDELSVMMAAIRRLEAARGDGCKRPAPSERDTAAVARRSLVAARDLPAGHRLELGDLEAKRPADGIAPDRLAAVLGRRTRCALVRDAPLQWEDLA